MNFPFNLINYTHIIHTGIDLCAIPKCFCGYHLAPISLFLFSVSLLFLCFSLSLSILCVFEVTVTLFKSFELIYNYNKSFISRRPWRILEISIFIQSSTISFYIYIKCTLAPLMRCWSVAWLTWEEFLVPLFQSSKNAAHFTFQHITNLIRW